MSEEITAQELDAGRFIKEKVKEIEAAVGDGQAINALSGGVDSSTVTMLGHRALGERLRTVFSMLVQELLAVVYETVAATGKPLDPPLLLLLDECANIAPIPNLAEIASTGAGQGVQLLSVFHDMAQVSSRALTVEDGWLYFLHGWMEHIKEVLQIEIDQEMFERLSDLASGLRPRLVPKFRSRD